MATKFFTVAILLITSMASIFSTCKKGGLGCANPIYSFKASATVYPNVDSVNIGDTIFLESNIPENQIDISSGRTVDYSHATNLSVSVQFLKFTGGSISNPGTIYVANKFFFVIIFGNQISDPFTEGQRSFSFKDQNNIYSLKIGMIPKDTGTYLIGISNSVNITRESDPCTKANYEIDFKNIDQHLYLYQNNRPGYSISDYEKAHGYCFKVK